MSPRLLAALTAAAVGVGCGAQEGEDPEEIPEVLHDRDLEPMWQVKCEPCHIGGSSFGGLWLDEGFAYEHLVDEPSHQAPDLDRIEPFELEESYLWLKANDRHREAGGYGEQIPVAWEDDELELVRDWILGGARR